VRQRRFSDVSFRTGADEIIAKDCLVIVLAHADGRLYGCAATRETKPEGEMP